MGGRIEFPNPHQIVADHAKGLPHRTASTARRGGSSLYRRLRSGYLNSIYPSGNDTALRRQIPVDRCRAYKHVGRQWRRL